MTDEVDRALLESSEAYVDSLFGEGAGAAHTQFLEHIEPPDLLRDMHQCHVAQAKTSDLSREENYLIGMCVLAASGAWAPATMFAKTLRHLGVPRDKILTAVGRMSMWVGPIRAAEASARIQRALNDYDQQGTASMAPWFPGWEGANGS